MKVAYVLKKSLRKRGEVGDVIKVAKGFGRYLEGQKIATRATKASLENLEKQKSEWQANEIEHVKKAQDLIEKIKGIEVSLKRRTSQSDKLYEAIRPEHVMEALAEKGIKVEKSNIKIDQQIKKAGTHEVTFHAYGNYETTFLVTVVSETEI